jgi:hypothetical protein
VIVPVCVILPLTVTGPTRLELVNTDKVPVDVDPVESVLVFAIVLDVKSVQASVLKLLDPETARLLILSPVAVIAAREDAPVTVNVFRFAEDAVTLFVTVRPFAVSEVNTAD